jgi:hypothetical protein
MDQKDGENIISIEKNIEEAFRYYEKGGERIWCKVGENIDPYNVSINLDVREIIDSEKFVDYHSHPNDGQCSLSEIFSGLDLYSAMYVAKELYVRGFKGTYQAVIFTSRGKYVITPKNLENEDIENFVNQLYVPIIKSLPYSQAKVKIFNGSMEIVEIDFIP